MQPCKFQKKQNRPTRQRLLELEKRKQVYGGNSEFKTQKLYTPPRLSDLFWIPYTGTTLPDQKTQAGVWGKLTIQSPKILHASTALRSLLDFLYW